MFIKAVQKRKVGTNENPLYFRLCESYRDGLGKTRQRMIMALGYMEDLPRWSDKQELCRLLNDMVLRHQYPMCENPYILELAHYFYQKLIDSNKIGSIRATESANEKEAERRRQEEVTIKLATLTNVDPKEIGTEHVALSCLDRLQIDRFLSAKRWNTEEIKLAKMQIAARTIYPFSEYKTVRVLQNNSALCELIGIDPETITKDKLYRSAHRLYELHHELEDWLIISPDWYRYITRLVPCATFSGTAGNVGWYRYQMCDMIVVKRYLSSVVTHSQEVSASKLFFSLS